MHFCADEVAVLAAAFPTFVVAFRWLKARIKRDRVVPDAA